MEKLKKLKEQLIEEEIFFEEFLKEIKKIELLFSEEDAKDFIDFIKEEIENHNDYNIKDFDVDVFGLQLLETDNEKILKIAHILETELEIEEILIKIKK